MAPARKYELLPSSAPFAAAPARSARMPRPRADASRALILALGCVCAAALVLVTLSLSRSSSSKARSTAPSTTEPVAGAVLKRVQSFSVSAQLVDTLDVVSVSFAYAAPHPPPLALAGDWIGVYCVESAGKDAASAISVDAYLDRRMTGDAAAGVVQFGPLVNMRCALQFRMVASDGAVLAIAPLVRFREGPLEPTQLHLAMGNGATQMRVMWTSANASRAGLAPLVRYGAHRDALDRAASATGTTYDAVDMCAAPATDRGPRQFRDPGVMYDALMTGLEFGMTYYYQVGARAVDADDNENDAWSSVRSFRLPPPAGHVTPRSDGKPLSMFVFGDLMSTTTATGEFRIPGSCGTTMALIERDLLHSPDREYAALIHVGDLSYAAGKTYVWDHFGTLIEPVASRIPYMVSIGNHDFGYLEGKSVNPARAPPHAVFEADGTHGHDSYGECGVPSEKRFHMPENGNGLWWYSMDIGLTHHTVLSGEHDFSVGSPMHEWMLRDFAQVDRAKTPWLIVHIHRPLYCSVAFGGDYQRSLYFRDHLESVFSTFHIDVVFTGHYHSYERTCPVFDEACYYGDEGEALAPVHIMVGSAGANVDTFGYYQVGWSEFARMEYGYGRLHVFNASHLQFEFVSNAADAVVDEMWIVSNHQWPSDRVRWRRWAFNPSLAFVIGAGVALSLGVGLLLLHRRRRVLAKAR